MRHENPEFTTVNGNGGGPGADATVHRAAGGRTGSLCELAVRLLAVDGAAVTIRGSQANRELVHATDEVITRLDDLQFIAGEGPCRDAFDTRRPVLQADISKPAALDRWPGFTQQAAATGARAVFAFPMQIGVVPIGVLELYRRRAGALTDREVAGALLLADTAAGSLLDDMHDADLYPDPARPHALFKYPEIPQATGMIATQRGIPIPQALAELRAAAYAADRSVLQVAGDVLARRITFRD